MKATASSPAAEVSQPDDVGEYTVIDQQRVHEEAYRSEVVAALLRDHGDAIMQFCVARLDEGLAEEVFVAAWERLPKYPPEAPLQAWPFGIVRNKCQQAYCNRALLGDRPGESRGHPGARACRRADVAGRRHQPSGLARPTARQLDQALQ
jgi:DNA-directed RNA polymerase specialized sigma24 family protein